MTTWTDVQTKAATPGSPILTQWRAQQEAQRSQAISNQVVLSSDPKVLEIFGVGPSASGVHVTPTSAMRVSAVFACVQRIASLATMPLNIYERTEVGRKRVEDADLWYLLNEQPTPRYTAVSHWEGVAGFQALRGGAYTFIGRSRSGAIRELIPLPWDAVQVERSKSDENRLKYYVQDVRTYGADQDDILHFPGFGFDGINGMSVIQWAARNAAGNAAAMDEYSGRFFANGAHPSIVLSSDKKMDPAQVTTLQTAFAAKYSGMDNSHRLPLVLTEGLKQDKISLSAEDSQLLEARKFQVVDIARAFGVPPHLIGETSASTSWGSGIESMGRGFVTFTLQPYLVRIEQELNRKLFRTAKYFVEFDRASLLQGDSKGQAEYSRAALGGPGTGPGWMTVDEVRREKNLPPLGGRCAQIFDPRDAPAVKSSDKPKEPDEKTPPDAA